MAARKARLKARAEGRPAFTPGPTEEISLRAYAASYLERHEGVLARHTFLDYETKYRRWIDADLGMFPVPAITRRDAEVWLASVIGRATSRATVVGAHRVLRLILSAAIRDGLISVNPAAGLRLPPNDPDRIGARRVLNEAQVVALLSHPDQTLRIECLLRAAAEGALRRSEIVGLRWPDVDLPNCRIEVRRGYQSSPTKGRRPRVIHIGPTFALRLKQWRAEAIKAGASITGPVWPGRDGGEMFESSPTHATSRALIRAGLVDDDGKPHVTLHGLRHTCASLMLSRGIPLIVVSRHLGHANPQITAQVYAHLIDDEQLAAVPDAFEAIFAANSP